MLSHAKVRFGLRLLVLSLLGCSLRWAWADDRFSETFEVEKADLTSQGKNPYFNLEPGYVLNLQGSEDDMKIVLTITVLNETKQVDGVETRVVEERETIDGQVSEVSRNYYAISKKTSDVFYFGEDVDTYEDGKVTNHEGSWMSGKDGAKFGLIMPGSPLMGARFYLENSEKAKDRAEIVSFTEAVDTPAGKFSNCMEIEESTPLDKDARAYKLFARGIGLVYDGSLKLTKYGK
jgi:hypothetical protein